MKFTPERQHISIEELGPLTPSRSNADVPVGAIVFHNVGLSQVLNVYSVLTDAELLIDPRLQSLPVSITFSNRQDLTQVGAVSFFEEELHKQAGLVFEHQDARHIAIRLAPNSVTK